MRCKLKTVVFHIEKKMDEARADQLPQALALELKEAGIQAICSWKTLGFMFGKTVMDGSLLDPEDTLYIADTSENCRMWTEAGNYTAAYIHPGNKEEDFAQIPYLIEDLHELGVQDLENIYRRYAGIPWDILETQRLRIREMTLGDVKALYEMYDDPQSRKFAGFLYEDPEEEKEYIRNYIEKVYPFYGYGMWIAEDKASGQVIGRVGFNFREGEDDTEYGYVIGQRFRGHGYATEAGKAILEYAWNEMKVDEVHALTEPDNIASIRVLEKMGMHLAGNKQCEGRELMLFSVNSCAECQKI